MRLQKKSAKNIFIKIYFKNRWAINSFVDILC